MNGLLRAFDIAASGPGAKLKAGDIDTAVRRGIFRWLHFEKTPDADAWLAANLDPIVAQALTQIETRPRCTHHGDGIILILRGVNMNPGADPEDMVSIRLWIERNRVISVRRRKLLAITDLSAEIENGSGPRSSSAFISTLTYKLTERMEPVITELSDKADELEDASIDAAKEVLRADIANLRREAIFLRRYIAPQKDALNRLSTDNSPVVSERNRIDLREAADRVTRLVEELDAVRERCAVLHDQLADARAEEMNKNMFVLSIVAAIFLPLGFLTGLLGVNVGGIPGADSPYAFLILCFVMIGVGVLIALIFKRLKWL